jgi:hypothetical protein
MDKSICNKATLTDFFVTEITYLREDVGVDRTGANPFPVRDVRAVTSAPCKVRRPTPAAPHATCSADRRRKSLNLHHFFAVGVNAH